MFGGIRPPRYSPGRDAATAGINVIATGLNGNVCSGSDRRRTPRDRMQPRRDSTVMFLRDPPTADSRRHCLLLDAGLNVFYRHCVLRPRRWYHVFRSVWSNRWCRIPRSPLHSEPSTSLSFTRSITSCINVQAQEVLVCVPPEVGTTVNPTGVPSVESTVLVRGCIPSCCGPAAAEPAGR